MKLTSALYSVITIRSAVIETSISVIWKFMFSFNDLKNKKQKNCFTDVFVSFGFSCVASMTCMKHRECAHFNVSMGVK